MHIISCWLGIYCPFLLLFFKCHTELFALVRICFVYIWNLKESGCMQGYAVLYEYKAGVLGLIFLFFFLLSFFPHMSTPAFITNKPFKKEMSCVWCVWTCVPEVCVYMCGVSVVCVCVSVCSEQDRGQQGRWRRVTDNLFVHWTELTCINTEIWQTCSSWILRQEFPKVASRSLRCSQSTWDISLGMTRWWTK